MINRNRIDPQRLHYLLQQYVSNACSGEELEELLSLVREDKDMQRLQQELKQYWDIRQAAIIDNEADWDERFEDMVKKAKAESQDFTKYSPEKRHRFTWMAAASFLIILMAGYYWHNHNPSGPQKTPAESNTVQDYKNDVAPGGNKAVLTLANGAKIVLDSAQNGTLARQGNSSVMKVDSGLLAYSQQSSAGNRQPVTGAHPAVQYNTLSTPRGGQYQLVLPDGSKVWLNAVSSIRYPTTFAEKEREVEITGEAYFEVAKNADRPFIVKLPPAASGEDQGEVKVLGTHFNVNAYDDETTVKVTLLEGAVKVSRLTPAQPGTVHSQLLLPGQQAIIDKEAAGIKITYADTEEAVAWKNGFLEFNNSSLKTIMRQISRWYDVDIRYEGDRQERFFTGEIPRNLSLSNVLKILALSNVHFKIEGRIITVIS